MSRRRTKWPLCGLFYLAALVICRIDADEATSMHAGHALGKVEFPITASPEAQAEFNHAVALLHHMTYPQARSAFMHVAEIDPTCAMAHWGIAMTLFQPLWPTRPGPEALRQGWAEVEKAKQLNPATERERLFVASVEAFFTDPASTDYWARIRRWESAMEKAYRAFPNDPEVMAFYALAYLATAPSNTISREHSDRAAEILLRLYKQNPDHPGAMHYLVHANDVPGREREQLEITRKYEEVAPDNPHALHMPTHIYTRLGDWDAVVRGNLRAETAALNFPAGEKGEFIWDEFPHAIEYLVYAYLQQGADDKAAEQVKRLSETQRLEPTFKTAFHLASTQARFALERRDWQRVADVDKPASATEIAWEKFAWPRAVTQFASGLASAHLGRVDRAQAAQKLIEELEKRMTDAHEELFARNIQILRLELAAWILQAQEQKDEAVGKMREAAELEVSTPKPPVTPAPTIPAHELLGDLLLENGRTADARRAYEISLERYPNRFNSLLGAARTARRAKDDAAARKHYAALLEIAQGNSRKEALDEAQEFCRGAAGDQNKG